MTALCAAFLVLEVFWRVAGVTDFPLYVREAPEAFVPAPNQRGRFLHRFDWAYNEKSMGVARPFQPVGDLLIGDSEIEGSVTFLRQADKIGPLLEEASGITIWPIGAKRWGLDNELAYLNSHPDLFGLKTIILLSNSGDFGPERQWDDEFEHPTRHPLIATPYLLARKFYRADPRADNPQPSPASDKIWHDALHRFLNSYKGRVIFVLLPIQSEVVNHQDHFSPLLKQLALENRSNVSVIRIADDTAWSPSFYQNNYHPNAAGNRELAAFVGPRIRHY